MDKLGVMVLNDAAIGKRGFDALGAESIRTLPAVEGLHVQISQQWCDTYFPNY